MRREWLAALLAVLVLSGCGNTASGGGAGSSAGSGVSTPAGSVDVVGSEASVGDPEGIPAESAYPAGSEAPELTEEDIQAAEAAARDYYAGTVFTVEGMEYLPQGSHPFAEGECNFSVSVRKDGVSQEDRIIQLDRTGTGWTVINEGY